MELLTEKKQEGFLLSTLDKFFIPELSRVIAAYLRWDGWIETNRIENRRSDFSKIERWMIVLSESGTVEIRDPSNLEVIKEFKFDSSILDCKLSCNGLYMMCINQVNEEWGSIISVIRIDSSDVVFSMGIKQKIDFADIKDHGDGFGVCIQRGDNEEDIWFDIRASIVDLAEEWHRVYEDQKSDFSYPSPRVLVSMGNHRFEKVGRENEYEVTGEVVFVLYRDKNTLLLKGTEEKAIVQVRQTFFDVLF